MAKTLTPSQIRNAARIESKTELNQSQRLALVSLSNNKENRAVAAADAADVVSKTLAGHYQQKPEAASLIIRTACGLEAALFDPLFAGFNGHKDQLPGLFAALADPYSALGASRAVRTRKLLDGGATPDQAAKIVGSDAALNKASASKAADKVRKLCSAFVVKYGTV